MSRNMKDSGIEWIGEIPEDWNLNKIGSIYDERNEKVSDKDFEALSVTKNGIVPQLESAAKTDNGDNRKLVKINDFVINSRSDRRGSCGISEYTGSVSLINIALKPRSNRNNLFYHFVFKSESFADEFFRWGNGIVNDLWSTKWSSMKRIYIPCPYFEEQTRIANYLDTHCTLIDQTIEKQKQVIEKLKEYKQSVITEAVTKGLNPNVQMKDSGIEWVGKIPNNWNYTKMKFVASFHNGDRSSKYPSGTDIVDSGVIFITSNNLGNIELNTNISTNKYISEEKYNDLGGAKIKLDDIIFCLRGSVGKCSINKNFNEGTIASSLVVIRANEIVAEYLNYVLQSPGVTSVAMLSAIGIGSLNLSASNIAEVVIPVPPRETQIEIIRSLQKKVTELDSATARKQVMIDKLTEYKKALIYECVTGKREVQ